MRKFLPIKFVVLCIVPVIVPGTAFLAGPWGAGSELFADSPGTKEKSSYFPIDLTTRDAYVRQGFDPALLRQTPGRTGTELEQSGWRKIPAQKGNRPLAVPDLKFKDLPRRKYLSLKEYKPQHFSALIRFDMPADRNTWPVVPALQLSSLGANWEIFLNGTSLRREIHLNDKGEIKHARHELVITPLDWRVLRPGQNEIAVHIIGDPTSVFVGVGDAQGHFIGEYETLKASRSELVKMILIFLYLFVGGYHLLLFSRRLKDVHNLYFGLFCICYFLYQFADSQTAKLYFLDTDIIYGVNYPAIYVLPILMIAFLESLVLRRLTWFTKIMGGIAVVICLLNIAMPITGYEEVLKIFFLATIPCLFYLLGFILYHTFHRTRLVYMTVSAENSSLTRFPITFSRTLFKTVEGNLFLGILAGIGAAVYDILDDLYFHTGIRLSKYGVFIVILGIATTLANHFLSVYNESDRLNEELGQKNHELSRLDKMKDEFLANTSHELRTPLNGIIGIAESLMDGAAGKLENPVHDNLEMIAYSGRRLSSLVNDLLDFSQLKTRELTLRDRPVDLYQITKLVLTLLGPIAQSRGLSLVNRVPRDIPAVQADEDRLQQVLNNLIGNGIKFTETGGISVSAEQQGDKILVNIEDTGIGIPEERQSDIFKSFEQVDASTTRKYGGTGLGLSISKQLIELHGGEMGLESKVGEGSRFYFTLPLGKGAAEPLRQTEPRVNFIADAPSASQETVVQPVERATAPEEKRANGQGLTVLVVDDEPINLQVVANYLSTEGYRIFRANGGAEALGIVQNGDARPDIILLDVMMPGMSGLDVCRILRDNYPANILPIIMLTAKNQVGDLAEGLGMGANDYLSKPFSKKELLARIRTHIDLAKINIAYNRFVPGQFLRYLEKESIVDVHLGDQVQKEMTVLFSDIRSFTTLSESMTPKENFDFINAYLKRVSPIIRNHGGFIDKYIGDAVMALFLKPEDALKASITVQHKLNDYNQERRVRGFVPLKVGIGLHAGSLMLGTIGDELRMEGTVISDAVNLASRMEGLTKMYGASIILSMETLLKLPDPYAYRHRLLDQVKVKGKRKVIKVVEIFDGDLEGIAALKEQTRNEFESGIQAYMKQDFETALRHFTEVAGANPDDEAAQLYEQRSSYFLEHGVPPEWEGVAVFDSK